MPRHFRRRRHGRGLWLLGLAAVAVAGAGGLVAIRLGPQHALDTLRGRLAMTSSALEGPRLRLDDHPAPPAPSALQDQLSRLAAGYGEPVGIAVTDVTAGWTAGVDADRPYPQQSVSKLWVALTVMRAVDEGRLDPNGLITLTEADRSVFFQPVAYSIGPQGFTTRLSALVRRALVESDNAANDRLMREMGGPEGVAAALMQMGLTRVKVGAYERDLQATTAGLVWRPEYGIGWNFQAAREALPMAERVAAMDAYLAEPLDGAAPAGITAALASLKRGELLSPQSTDVVIGLMHDARTGPRRLKGGLPPGWTIAHKTGTGQDFRGASVGINDVGLLTAPDGRTYAVAVMLRHTRQPVPARLAFMQSVTRAIADQWLRESQAATATPAD